ncbi:MAG: DUF1330 domain-containing protein [Steroidobacteraceae bacterium]|nr:DUF1330 domain-containing protein [Steroidobacteraceae bacterium]
MPRILPAALLMLASATASAASPLDDFMRLQVGNFTSDQQAKADSRYDTAIWHIVEIWTDDKTEERWLYTESWIKDSPQPYIQRISRVVASPDGTITTQRFTIPEPARFIGAWQDPAKLAALKPAELTAIPGCDTTVVRAGKDRFEGGTAGTGCRNRYKNADYAISRITLGPDGMSNWDRGFRENGEQVWGPVAGGYRFRRADAPAGCTAPVRMLVYGEVQDRAGFLRYVKAIRDSGLYERTGGYYEAMTPAIEVFEGSPPPTRGVVISRFPCLEAARSFWNSPEYREIVKLREGIASFEVLVLPVPPVPRYVTE